MWTFYKTTDPVQKFSIRKIKVGDCSRLKRHNLGQKIQQNKS